jgi:hypothetical protein
MQKIRMTSLNGEIEKRGETASISTFDPIHQRSYPSKGMVMI